MQQYKPDAADKLDAWVITDITPQQLQQARDAIITGDTIESEKLFRTMLDRWPELQKAISEKEDAIKALNYSIIPWAERGESATPEAQATADMIESALWSAPSIPLGSWALGFEGLLGSLTHTLARGLSVFQIKKRYDKSKGYFVPSSFTPVLPQYYGWATNQQERDQLLFYPEGYNNGRGSSKYGGYSFPADEFIVALSQRGLSHPLFNAQLRCLVGYFGAACFGLKWLMQYSRTFGMPLTHATVSNPDDLPSMADFLARAQADKYLVTEKGKDIDVSYISAPSSASMPHDGLIKLADEQACKLILGQTLTSSQGDKGSQALGTVHKQVRADYVDAAADFVCSIINEQLIPAICRWNYGHDFDGKLPRIEHEKAAGNNESARIDYLARVINTGIPVGTQYAYDYLNLPRPSAAEDILNPRAIDPVNEAAAALRAPKL